VVAEARLRQEFLGEMVNIVMYNREINLLARFSKMTAQNFNYCKDSSKSRAKSNARLRSYFWWGK
jgi:hypothetical protein